MILIRKLFLGILFCVHILIQAVDFSSANAFGLVCDSKDRFPPHPQQRMTSLLSNS